MATMKDRWEAFSRFAHIESEFEPLEAMILKAASEIEEAIQSEIEQMLGK